MFASNAVQGRAAREPEASSFRSSLAEASKCCRILGFRRQVRDRQRRELVEVDMAIPPVARCWAERSQWKLAFRGRWRWPAEHINIKEARIALDSVRRLSRAARDRGCRTLHLIDNMVTCLSFDKGRSRSWALNSVCRRLASYVCAAGVRPRWRHIDSEICAAATDSRWCEPAAGGMSRIGGPDAVGSSRARPRTQLESAVVDAGWRAGGVFEASSGRAVRRGSWRC